MSFEEVLLPLDEAGLLEPSRGLERLERSEAAHAEDLTRLHIDADVFAELDGLIAEIGADTHWTELESLIRSTVTTELGRDVHPAELQQLLERWVELERGAEAAS